MDDSPSNTAFDFDDIPVRACFGRQKHTSFPGTCGSRASTAVLRFSTKVAGSFTCSRKRPEKKHANVGVNSNVYLGCHASVGSEIPAADVRREDPGQKERVKFVLP